MCFQIVKGPTGRPIGPNNFRARKGTRKEAHRPQSLPTRCSVVDAPTRRRHMGCSREKDLHHSEHRVAATVLRLAHENARRILAAPIHFAFDQSDIEANDRALLDQRVAILVAHRALQLTMEGNAVRSPRDRSAAGRSELSACSQRSDHLGAECHRWHTKSGFGRGTLRDAGCAKV